MTKATTATDSFVPASETASQLFDNWFDPIESGLRERVRGFIEEMIRGELDAALDRPRYGRAKSRTQFQISNAIRMLLSNNTTQLIP
jgi:putative transposase